MADIQRPSALDASSAKPVPLPLPSTPRIPHPSAQTLRMWLPLYLKKADTIIAHLSRILSTPSGTDTLLLAVGYSTLATSSLLSRISLHRLHISILRLFASLATIPTGTTILLAPTAIEAPRLLRISESLRALSDLIGDFRIFVRLWGLLGIWKWGRGLLQSPPKDKILARIAWAEVSVNIAYQVLENGAYLASKGVLGWDTAKQNKAWVWSSRFWAMHVGLELVRLAYLRDNRAGKGKEGEVQDGYKIWWRDLVANLAYAPLTLHWSREGGLVSDLWVGVLGTVAGAVGITELWENTR